MLLESEVEKWTRGPYCIETLFKMFPTLPHSYRHQPYSGVGDFFRSVFVSGRDVHANICAVFQ